MIGILGPESCPLRRECCGALAMDSTRRRAPVHSIDLRATLIHPLGKSKLGDQKEHPPCFGCPSSKSSAFVLECDFAMSHSPGSFAFDSPST